MWLACCFARVRGWLVEGFKLLFCDWVGLALALAGFVGRHLVAGLAAAGNPFEGYDVVRAVDLGFAWTDAAVEFARASSSPRCRVEVRAL